MALIACQKKIELNFHPSPADPRAGQPVTFFNTSTGGEDWEWEFGDGGKSSLKSPTYTYKKPGTYLVKLKVNKKNTLTLAQQIVVKDTIPTFTCSDETFEIYNDYTFTAQLYNPYNLAVDYLWTLDSNLGQYAVVTDTSMTGKALNLFFVKPMAKAPVSLRIIVDGRDTTTITKELPVENVLTRSVLLRADGGDYRQRIYGKRAAKPELDTNAAALLNSEQDTFQIYNGETFRLSELQEIFPEMEGFHIASRKIYFRHEGLWVANIDGANFVQIDEAPCYAMTLDNLQNRIYWANDRGVWYMPFVGSDNNQFVSVPIQLNDFTDVTCIAIDNEKK